MAKITSITEENARMSIKELYLDHTNALAIARTGKKNFPTLKELWEKADEREKKKKEKRKRKRGGCTMPMMWLGKCVICSTE